METQSPSPKRERTRPQFSAHVYCGQTAGWIKMILGMEVGLSPGDLVVLDGNPAPFPKKGTEPLPQFLAHFYCGQAAGCTKMPLDMELCLSPGDFVLDGDPALPPKFSAHVYYSYCDFARTLHNVQSLGLFNFKFKS